MKFKILCIFIALFTIVAIIGVSAYTPEDQDLVQQYVLDGVPVLFIAPNYNGIYEDYTPSFDIDKVYAVFTNDSAVPVYSDPNGFTYRWMYGDSYAVVEEPEYDEIYLTSNIDYVLCALDSNISFDAFLPSYLFPQVTKPEFYFNSSPEPDEPEPGESARTPKRLTYVIDMLYSKIITGDSELNEIMLFGDTLRNDIVKWTVMVIYFVPVLMLYFYIKKGKRLL